MKRNETARRKLLCTRLHSTDGFTLVELLVSIVVASIVMLAATTVLLLGLRINNQANRTATRQNTARILMTMLDDLAAEGSIDEVKADETGWKILDSKNTPETMDDTVILAYNAEEQAIYPGDPEDSTTPLMEDVVASHVTKSDNGLLQFAVETTEGSYNSSVFCRTAGTKASEEIDTILDGAASEEAAAGAGTTEQARTAFLNVLASQYKMGLGGYSNPGLILVQKKIGAADSERTVYLSSGTYYAEWYNDEWGETTPWCACYVSWALNQVRDWLDGNPADRTLEGTEGEYRWYANVDEFMYYLQGKTADGNQNAGPDDNGVVSDGNTWQNSTAHTSDGTDPYTPLPGDLIFFDWTGGTNPAHVGVVLRTTDDRVYTIEGNSADTVAVRQYSLNDRRIIGYGVLNWKPDPA